MTDLIIIILLAYLILKEYKRPSKIDPLQISEEEKQKQKKREESLDRMMEYSIEDAIRSKRGDN